MMQKKGPRPVDVEGVESTEAEGYYALFPADATADEAWTPVNPDDVLEVRLYRQVGNDQEHLDNYSATELPDEKAVRALHGGGRFLAVAIDNRPRKRGRVLRRRTFKLAGEPSKPAIATTPAPAAPAPASGEMPAWAQATITLASTILPPVLLYMQQTGAASREESAKHQQLLMEAMRGDRQAFVDLMKAIAPAREPAPAAPAGTSLGAMKEVVGVMKELGFKQPKEPDVLDKALENLIPMFAMNMMGRGLPPGIPGAGGALPALAN